MEKDITKIRKTVEDMHRLMEQLVALQMDSVQCCRAVTMSEATRKPAQPPEQDSPGPDALKACYDEAELMTIKEAAAFIPACRTKLYEWRTLGVLHTVERSSRNKRLIRTEVEAMHKWAVSRGKR